MRCGIVYTSGNFFVSVLQHEDCIGELNVEKKALIDENTALKKRIHILTDNEVFY